MKKIIILLILQSLIFMTSCGEDSKKKTKNSSLSLDGQPLEGSYRAILRPLNNHLSGYLPSGLAKVEIKNGQLEVLTLLDDDAKVMHLQMIQSGSSCPEDGDDKNQDGVIDIIEAKSSSGETYIHLDGELDANPESDGRYPWGSGFTYKKTAILTSIENEIKIRTGKNLDLSNKVVMIYGVSKTTPLPVSVSGHSQWSKDATIPVACGLLKR